MAENHVAARAADRPLAVWLWAVAGAAACAAMAPLEPSLLEEGLLLHFAERIAAGEHLYRDLVYFSGPLPFELLAALFRVFGAEISVARAAVVLLHGLATAAIFAIAVRVGAEARSHLAAAAFASAPVLLFPLYSIYFYTTIALHLCVLATYAAVRGIGSPRWAAVAGVLLACAALSKQNLGAFAAIGIGAALAVAPGARGRRVGAWIAGGAAIALVTLLFYGIRGDLGPLLRQTIAMPLSLETSFASPFVNLLPPGRFEPAVAKIEAFYLPHLYNILTGQSGRAPAWAVFGTQVLFALPFVAALRPFASLARGNAPSPAVWVHEALLVALVCNLFPRTDWGHLVFALPAAVTQLCLGAGARESEGGARRRGRGVVFAAVVLLAAGAALAAAALHRRAGAPSFGPRVPQPPVSRAYQSPGVPRVIEFLRRETAPGEAVFVARAEPLVYFASRTRNPTPYGGVLPTDRPVQEQTIVTALEEVRYVVMSEIDQPLFLYYRDELPAVQAHLERHFRIAPPFRQRPSWIPVLERGADRGPTASDLFDLRRAGRRYVLDGNGSEGEPASRPPVLATRMNRRPLAIALGAGGGGIDFDVAVPPRGIFQAGIGLRAIPAPGGTVAHARNVTLEVLARRRAAESEPFALLASEAFRRGAGTWRPLEVDLSGYAGGEITLRLQARTAGTARPGALAWWGSPRIAQTSAR